MNSCSVESAIKGDWGSLMGSVSQLALTFATGGAGALFAQLPQMLAQFGSQMLSQGIANMTLSDLAQAAIQQMGQQMGLPQSAIDAAQAAFCDACGDRAGARENFREAGMANFFGGGVSGKEREMAQAFLSTILAGSANPSPVQAGQAQSQASNMVDSISQLLNDIISDLRNELSKDSNGNPLPGAGAAAGAGGGANGAGTAGAGAGDGAAAVSSTGGAEGGMSLLMRIAVALGSAIDEKMKEMDKLAGELEGLSGEDEGYGAKTAKMSALGQEMKMVSEALNNTLKSIGESASSLARKQ